MWMCELCEKCTLINQLTWLSKTKYPGLIKFEIRLVQDGGRFVNGCHKSGRSAMQKGAGPFCVVLSGLRLMWWSLICGGDLCIGCMCVLVLEPSCGVSAALNNADGCVKALLRNAVFHLACCCRRRRQQTCVTGTILNSRPNWGSLFVFGWGHLAYLCAIMISRTIIIFS